MNEKSTNVNIVSVVVGSYITRNKFHVFCAVDPSLEEAPRGSRSKAFHILQT